MRLEYPRGRKLTTFCGKKFRGAGAVAAPKCGARRWRRDVLRRVTLYLCPDAAALSYIIV